MGFIGDFFGTTKPISFRQGENVRGARNLLRANSINVSGLDSVNGESVISVPSKDYERAIALINQYYRV